MKLYNDIKLYDINIYFIIIGQLHISQRDYINTDNNVGDYFYTIYIKALFC